MLNILNIRRCHKRPTPTKDKLGVATKDQHLQKTNSTKDQHYKRPTLQKTNTYKRPTLQKTNKYIFEKNLPTTFCKIHEILNYK